MRGYGRGRGGFGRRTGSRRFKCLNCGYEFEVPFGQPKPRSCPKCGAPANMIVRADKGFGKGPGRGKGFGGASKYFPPS